MLPPEKFQQRLDEWLEINVEQWNQLRSLGVKDGSEVELDYSFSTEDENEAKNFLKNLKEKFSYEAKIEFLPADENGNSAIWAIFGTTPPTKTDLEFLNIWVKELIHLGQVDNCLFEGWGAYPPGAKPQFSLGLGSFEEVDESVKLQYPVLLHIKIPEHIEPIDRGEKYDDPLSTQLEAGGYGKILRVGSLLSISENGVEIVGIEMIIRVKEKDSGIELLKGLLIELGAPINLTIEVTDPE